MKRVVLVVLGLLFVSMFCFADNVGVQMIGGPGIDSTVASVDNMKLNQEITIDGYATIKFTTAEEVDRINWYQKGYTDIFQNNWRDGWDNSGQDAQYYTIKADIINLAFAEKDFLKNCTVKIIYDDQYIFRGWCHQYNWNNGSHNGQQNKTAYINDGDRYPIGMMYTGHYVFGCTLPNPVMISNKSLKMIITIDGNELTYIIRK